MRDLLEKLMQLTEAPVQPGERKGISFKLKKLDKVASQLSQYKNSMNYMQAAKMPPDLQAEMKALQDKLNTEIEKVNQAYQTEYEKSIVNDRPVKMNNLFNALAKNCKEIIKVYKELNRNNFEREKFLFRGIKSNDDALYGKPFEARKPKDSNRDLHELVNDAINNLGFTANRENAMFVTGDRSQASGYGHALYIMFPVDGFSFTWSQTVKDLVLDSGKKLDMMDKEVVNQLRNMVRQAKASAEDPNSFPISDPSDLFYSGYNYDHDYERVSRAIETGVLSDEAQDLLDNILTNQSIQEHFQFTDSNLFGAILSEKEIYIRGNYYAVNIEHKKELFKFLEQINTDDVELPENFGEVPDLLDKGDVVRILSGAHQGKLGTITYVYSDSYEVYLTPKTGDITIPRTDVELYKLPDGSIPIYQKDDEVIITDPDNRLYGSVVKLNFVYPNGKVEFVDKNGNYHTAFKNQFELYSAEREQEILKDLETKPPTIENNDDVVVSDPDSEYYMERGRVNYIYSTGTIEVYLQKKGEHIEFQPNQLVLVKNAPPELLKTETGVFHVGDKVQIVSGEWQGYYATVEYLYSQGTKAEVDLIGMDKRVDVWLNELEHYGQEKKETKFKVGDKVKILVGDNAGEEAIVNYVSTVFPDEIDVKLVKNDLLKTVPTSGVELVADESSKALKVGDYVKIINTKSLNHNDIGQVTANLPNGNVQVKIKNTLKAFGPQEVELTDSPEVPNFKVGDTIQVLNSESTFYQETGEVIEVGYTEGGKEFIKFKNASNPAGVKTFADWVKKVDSPAAVFKPNDKVKIKNKSYSVDGSIATILEGPDEDGDYKLVTVDGKIVFTNDTQMEKLESAPDDEKLDVNIDLGSDEDATFNVGEFVKILEKSSGFYGDIGKIESGPDSDGDFVVRFEKEDEEDGQWSYFNKNQMQPIKKPKSTKTEPEKTSSTDKLKEGDTVKIINGPEKGKIGKVKFVWAPIVDEVEVEFGNGEKDDFQLTDVEKVPDNEVIDNLKWEPEPEVQAPAPKLAVDDRVEVVSQFPSLLGKTGTVTQVSANYDFVTVWLDGNSAASSFPISSLKKITDSTPTVADFKTGEYVEVTNANLSSYGKQGKVIDINPSYLFVEFPNTGESAVKPTSVKKIAAPVQKQLTIDDFQDYDTVKVTDSNYPKYYNQTGYVTGKLGDNLIISINDTPYVIPPSAVEKIS